MGKKFRCKYGVFFSGNNLDPWENFFLPTPLSNPFLVAKVLRAGCKSTPLCFVDKFPLKPWTLNVCQTHPFQPSFCQLWLLRLSDKISLIESTDNKVGGLNVAIFLNLEDFVSGASFAPFFERDNFLRYLNFVSWSQVWFSDQGF